MQNFFFLLTALLKKLIEFACYSYDYKCVPFLLPEVVAAVDAADAAAVAVAVEDADVGREEEEEVAAPYPVHIHKHTCG